MPEGPSQAADTRDDDDIESRILQAFFAESRDYESHVIENCEVDANCVHFTAPVRRAIQHIVLKWSIENSLRKRAP